MMTLDVLLLAAAAASTAIILFAVVLFGDFQNHHPQPNPNRIHK
jgi:hypothetical protein